MADTTTASKRISRAGALSSAIAGGDARRDGQLVTDCPHPATGTVTDRFYAHYWRKGWRAADTAD